LAAFVQASDEPAAQERLKQALERVPAVARPTLTRLETLPLTARGKLDRAALQQRAGQLYQAPAVGSLGQPSPYLELVAHVIGCATLSPEDDFFEAGGHSLAAFRLISLAREKFGASLTVRDVFEVRQAGKLAALIEAAAATVSGPHGCQVGPAVDWRLSPFEAAVYVEDQLSPGPSSYIIRETIALNGSLEPKRLRSAVRQLLLRHPILRSKVEAGDGGLFWVDRPVAEVLTQVGPHASCPVQPEGEWPGLRVQLSTKAEVPQLEVTCHHAVMDGAALDHFFAELAEAYRSDCSPGATLRTVLPPFECDDSLGPLWRHALEGLKGLSRIEPETNDSAPRTNAAVQAQRALSISPRSLAEVGELISGSQFAVAAACAAAWFHRVSSSTDVVLWTVAAGAVPVGGLRAACTLLPVRYPCGSRTTFLELARSGARNLAWALDHRAVRQDEILRIVRDKTGARDIHLPVLFDLEDRRNPLSLDFGGIRGERLHLEPETVRADLEITLRIHPDHAASVVMRGRQSLYSARALEGWCASLTHFSSRLMQDPTLAVSAVPLIDADSEYASVRRGPVAALEHDPVPQALRRCFQQASRRRLIGDGNSGLTGHQAEALAEVIGCRLVEAGVVLGNAVFCELPRTIAYPSVLLGVWLAGAVPVLVNAEHPAGRKLAMRGQLPPAAIIQMQAEELGSVPVLGVEPLLRQTLDDACEGVPVCGPKPLANTAYVAFTSGSAGKPKPVACSWAGLSHLLGWSHRHTPLLETDVFLHIATPGFDIALWEMLYPLLRSASLLVAAQQGAGNLPDLIRLCETQGVTHVHFVPALLSAFLDALEPNEGRSLKLVFCGGDMTPANLCQRLWETRRLPLQHCYGPTESTIFALSWRGDGEPQTRGSNRLPLGDPVDGAVALVVDRAGHPVVRGVLGELAIAGSALARGYPGNGRETAARFRPTCGSLGGRMYLTGDLGLMRPDGTIEFHGRTDRQIKIAGVRIELEEVEAVLAGTPGVTQAFVSHRRDQQERDHLIAYLFAGSDRQPTEPLAEAALQRARERLPSAAVPRRIVVLDELPLTSNGKVDYRRLSEMHVEEQKARPRSCGLDGLELRLAELWKVALGLKTIGPDEDFFALGGDSIAAIRVTALAKKKGLELHLADVFQNPTIRRLGKSLRERQPVVMAPHTIPCEQEILLAPTARAWLSNRENPAAEGLQSVVLRAPTPNLDRPRLERAWERVLRRRDSLNFRVRQEDGRWRVLPGKPLDTVSIPLAPDVESALAMARRQVLPESGVMAGLALIEGRADCVAVCIHHLAADLHSWTLILNDLWSAYTQHGTENEASPPDYASWSLAAFPARPLRREVLERMPRRFIRGESAEMVVYGAVAQLLPPTPRGRVSAILAAVAEALATVIKNANPRIDLEVDLRDPRLGFQPNAEEVVGWLAAFVPFCLEPAGTGRDAWLRAAEHALAARHDVGEGRTGACALNIVGTAEAYFAPFSVVGAEDFSQPPLHPIAIEVEVCKDQVRGRVECDTEIPAGAAGKVAQCLAAALRRGATGPIRKRLTPLQQAMAAEHLRQPRAGLYHTQIMFALGGNIDLSMLRESWVLAAQKHDAFRIRVDFSRGDPDFLIMPDVEVPWRVHQTEGDVERACDTLLDEDRADPFDLETGPLSRLTLVSGLNGSRLIWSHHHLILDGWSLNIVLRSVGEIYGALAGATPGPVSSAPSFALFADWWDQQDIQRSFRHWVQVLSQSHPPPRSAPPSSEGVREGAVRLVLSAADTNALNRFCLAHQTTLHQLTLAAWALVLARQNRCHEVMFGIVVSLRPAELDGVDEIAGLLMNTVPFRVSISSDVDPFLSAIRTSLIESLDFSVAPLSAVLAELKRTQWDGDVETLLVFENYPGERTGVDLGTTGRLGVLGAWERSDLPLVLVALPGDTLQFEFMYRGRAFGETQAKRLCTQLERVLSGFSSMDKPENK
jgi:amino acid adenylation domain-containing protein